MKSWSNIRLTVPNTYVENDYLNDICDFWDSTGFYVNFTQPVTHPPMETTSGSPRLNWTGPGVLMLLVAHFLMAI